MARRLSDRTPELVILAVMAALAVGALLLAGGGSTSATSAGSAIGDGASVSPAHIAQIERRVEELRDLRFRHPVPVAVVSPTQARREGIAEYDRSQPLTQRRENEELLKLLGLLPPSADLRQIESDVFGEQVAGYYDPRRKRLALVRGAGVDDVTLAHELTHALEDQHADLGKLGAGGGNDASTAQQALVEGTATLVMQDYAARWPSNAPLGDALAGLTQVTGATPLPAYMARTLVFPYFQGESFVQALRNADGGGWGLVDVAERKRPPQTTAEILEPTRWLRAEQPAPVSLAGADAALSAAGGWRRLSGSTLGEEDLAALLAPQSGPLAARELTAGWRGGRYALWRRGPLVAPGCPSPCRSRDVMAMTMEMDDPAAADALGAALAAWLTGTLHARRVSTNEHGGLWRLPDGSFGAVRGNGSDVHAALAPDAALATRLVQ
ncbi:MAG TPA: hypothetical protein VGO48_13485 [Conexibacter sp.]|jgi:hypothetical protein|nr:hypothetical protein [Conexibacter sp.]